MHSAIIDDERWREWLGLPSSDWAVVAGRIVGDEGAQAEAVSAATRAGAAIGLVFGTELRRARRRGLLRSTCVDIEPALCAAAEAKDSLELALLARVATINRRALSSAVRADVVGRPAFELVDVVEQTLRADGWSGDWAFDVSVGISDQLRRNWVMPSQRVMQDGDLVSVDMGIRQFGVCADMTATWVAGNAADSESLRSLRELMQVVPTVLHAGRRAKDVARDLMDWLRRRGYQPADDIAVGHGIGATLHQTPVVGPASDDFLRENMVVCIEPCIVERDGTRVRLEEMFRIGRGDAEMVGVAAEGV